MQYEVFWLVAAVVLGIIEALTLGIVTLWFAIGALFAMVAAMIGLSFLYQMIVFIISSAVLLYFTRPIAKNYLKLRTVRTNADSLVGKTGIVLEKIDNMKSAGQVKVQGQVWSARSSDGSDIAEEEKVEIVEISGVKLIVKRLDHE